MLRTLLAPNASAMTLDGTRTRLVGSRQVAIIDPGPDSQEHIDAIVAEVAGASAIILVTHQHPDHSAGVERLAALLGADARSHADGTLRDGDEIATDAGPLVALVTPGHAPDHVSLHWPADRAIFVGDLMMGGLDTALVAPPEGNLRDYLHSLDRLQALRPRTLYPSHGPDFTEPDEAFDSYRAHRTDRLGQVRKAFEAGARDREALVNAVYGAEVPPALRGWARQALDAYLDYLGVEVE